MVDADKIYYISTQGVQIKTPTNVMKIIPSTNLTEEEVKFVDDLIDKYNLDFKGAKELREFYESRKLK